MPFNLRGGRPKSMKQGIYWVQRHQADQRRQAQATAAEARQAELLEQKHTDYIATYERLFNNVKAFFDANSEFSVNQRQADAIATRQAQWEEQRTLLVESPELISVASLKRLGTAGKNLITDCARAAKLSVSWNSASKKLTVGKMTYDFR